jgi:membrane protease YdiL (CAAX protease family)
MKLKTSKTQQLIIFFVLAFFIGWLAFIPIFLYHTSPTPGAFIFLFSPALAALITAALANGIIGVKEVLRRYLIWKFPLRWYSLALLLLPAIFLVAGLISFRTNLESVWTGSPWYFLIASFGYLMFINSGEEIGWRGFALSRLQSVIKNPLVASIVLGAIWGLWHLPLYLNPEQSSFPLILFLLFIMGISIIYSVLFNNTHGSLLMAVVLHASTDIAPRFMQIANFTPVSWSIIVACTWISAMILYYVTKTITPVTCSNRQE